MTPCAGRHVDQIITVKCALAVVALIAVIRRGYIVLLSGDIADLATLPALTHVMALLAALTRMGSVREYRLKNVSRLRRAVVRCDRVADAALADLALRCVAAKAVVMSSKRHRNMPARTCKIVTSDAALRRFRIAAVMHRVVELHIKSLNKCRRESLHRRRRRLHIFMADRAHRLVLVRELIQVTADARLVTRIIHLERFALAVMARRAVELLMFFDRVRERLECLVRCPHRHRLRRLGRCDRRRRTLVLLEAARSENNKRAHDEHETESCLR